MNLSIFFLVNVIYVISAQTLTWNNNFKKKAPTIPIATQCGIRNINGTTGVYQEHKGAITQFGEFPWMAGIKMNDKEAGDSKIFKCGASLIHKRVALTAAHCVDNIGANEITVVFGEWDSTNESMDTTTMEVDKIVVHENFEPSTLFNNIALIFLSFEVTLSENINIVCLPLQDQIPPPNVGCMTAGWGKREVGNPEILQYSDLPILRRDTCENALRKTVFGHYYNLDQSFICTGKRAGQGQCIGDGGAPLFCRRNDQLVQFGIVSFNFECKWPTVYTNVSMFMGWIKEKMKTESYVLDGDDVVQKKEKEENGEKKEKEEKEENEEKKDNEEKDEKDEKDKKLWSYRRNLQ